MTGAVTHLPPYASILGQEQLYWLYVELVNVSAIISLSNAWNSLFS